MDATAGPSNVFSSHLISVATSSRDPSYYSNMEPDFQWVRESVKSLIYLVSVHFDEFYDKTVKKKVLWKKIAEEMKKSGYKCSSDDCDKKWRNIKKSYVTVLQKQVQGDFSSKFPYFDQMHAFLGKEIDPLGMREQGLNKAIQEKGLPDSEEYIRTPFYEVTEDDSFEWNESAVHLLLDLVLEHRDIFRINSDIDSVWESISDKMCLEGYSIIPEQCQRKWVNLAEGFRYYQSEAEVSGIHPKWIYFSRVRRVISTFNVPVTVVKEKTPKLPTIKASITTPAVVRDPPRRRKRRRGRVERTYESDENESLDDKDVGQSLLSSIRRLQRSLNVDDRLSHLEDRIEAAQKQKAAVRHSNNLLGLILSELKRINRSFEEKRLREEERREEQRQQQYEEDDDDEQRLKEGILLNHVGQTPIVDEAACREAILNMQNITNFQFMKAPKVELVDNQNEGIIIVEDFH